ncbi:MAG: glycosyltransferase family 2 protein [Thermoanaerobaculia bacterium]
MELSVVVPAFNESHRLPATLERILTYLSARGERFEILVVDDGSTDDTATLAEGFSPRGVRVLRHPGNRGKGAALRTGVAASLGEWVLLCDADLATPIEEIERLRAHAGDADVVAGSRAVTDADIVRRQPFYREAMGRSFNLWLRLLGLTDLGDTQCGFKLLRGEAARQLFARLTIERFAWDVELLQLARREGLRVVEVGVVWRHEPESKVHPVRDSWGMLLDSLRLRRRLGSHRRRRRGG